VVEDHADEKSHKETSEESGHDTIPTEAEKHCREKEKDEISEIEQLLEDLKEKVRDHFNL
jgi:ribosomal protein S25